MKMLMTELIGSEIEIVSAKNNALIGLKGVIIDETKNMIQIESNGKEKSIIKSQVTLKMKDKNKACIINGKLLAGRPEDRIKARSLR